MAYETESGWGPSREQALLQEYHQVREQNRALRIELERCKNNYVCTSNKLNDKDKPMNKVNVLSKLFLDEDTKTLVEAGILNNNLEIADQSLVMMFFVQKYKKEMAEFARENILEKPDNKAKASK